jgi:hypothetical protein
VNGWLWPLGCIEFGDPRGQGGGVEIVEDPPALAARLAPHGGVLAAVVVRVAGRRMRVSAS